MCLSLVQRVPKSTNLGRTSPRYAEIPAGNPAPPWNPAIHMGERGAWDASDVAVMLPWCLWPMRVVLPGGLTLCQSISTRTILHRVLPPSGQFHCRDTRQNWLFGASSNWLCPAAARPPQESRCNRGGGAPAAFREKSSEGDGTVKRVLVNSSFNSWHWAKAVSTTTAPLAPLEPDWKHLRTAVVKWATCGLSKYNQSWNTLMASLGAMKS